jgi:RNA polymerase sigma-B factor
VKAVERFDPAHGTAFTSFATPTILGEIKRYFRDYGWMVRVPRDIQERALRVERVAQRLGDATPADVARELGIREEDVVEALLSASAHRPGSLEPAPHVSLEDPGFARAEDDVALGALLGSLPELERAVVTLRFRDDLLQREIGELLGLSQMQVSRVLARALQALQEAAGG